MDLSTLAMVSHSQASDSDSEITRRDSETEDSEFALESNQRAVENEESFDEEFGNASNVSAPTQRTQTRHSKPLTGSYSGASILSAESAPGE